MLAANFAGSCTAAGCLNFRRQGEINMNWEIIGATGEWAGALAVVASLIYLASQIRISNKQTQSSARFSFLDSYGQMSASIIENKHSASVYRRGLSAEDLDPDEELQFLFLLGQWINTWSVMYELHCEGQLPEGQWFIARTDLLSTLTTVGGREYWGRLGELGTQPAFFNMVEELLSEQHEANDWFAPRNLDNNDDAA